MSYEDILSSIKDMKFGRQGKYAHKLGFDQRCEILALYRTGVPRVALAEAYGIDRRTVTHIYNPRSSHYKDVKAEEEKLGKEAFQRQYITENGLNKLKTVMETFVPVSDFRPIRNATKYRGVHVIETEQTTRPHRIIVQYREAGIDNVGAGWYYQDRDGQVPEQWLHNGEESRMTSKACLEAAREQLFDL
jgi:hypothetical protein